MGIVFVLPAGLELFVIAVILVIMVLTVMLVLPVSRELATKPWLEMEPVSAILVGLGPFVILVLWVGLEPIAPNVSQVIMVLYAKNAPTVVLMGHVMMA